jgi:3-methyl-2-oxobutanoate hydroxymethyltransferase
MTLRPTVYDMHRLKGQRKLIELHVDSALEAAAGAEAGIDMFSCEHDPTLPLIRAAAPSVFIQAGIAFGAVASPEEGIRQGFAALAAGADCVYFSGSLRILEAMAREGIPVTGHVGLVPDWATWTNFRAVGRDPHEAAEVYRRMKTLESAGAWAVEVEVVPLRLAAFLTANTPMITEGMGCGTACDTIYLFSCDVLGTHAGHYPRHAKKYGDIAKALDGVQRLRVQAMADFVADVRSGGYPEAKHQLDIEETAFEEFSHLVARA